MFPSLSPLSILLSSGACTWYQHTERAVYLFDMLRRREGRRSSFNNKLLIVQQPEQYSCPCKSPYSYPALKRSQRPSPRHWKSQVYMNAWWKSICFYISPSPLICPSSLISSGCTCPNIRKIILFAGDHKDPSPLSTVGSKLLPPNWEWIQWQHSNLQW